MKLKILICSFFPLILGAFLFIPKAHAVDDKYLKGRAIELANFSDDDIVVEPKMIYNFAPGKVNLPELITPNAKVVNLVNPRYSPASITAVFEAPKYLIEDQSNQLALYSFKRRVGDILADGGVVLAKEDIISPSIDTPAPTLGGNLIKITRVSLAEIEEFESVPYREKKSDDPEINKGVQKVTKIGKNGRERLLYRVRRENGKEVEKKLISREIVEKPQDQLVSVGTRPIITVRCRYNDIVSSAAAKYSVDANSLCTLMMKESNGNASSVNPDGYYGLFQYNGDFWASASAKAGYGGASWSDPTAQIYTTAYCFSHGLSNRW